ncbi:ralBP1-associated Eps domain-containing protein 2 isoform X2 [Protopterus annectens]|uniref:ralBP1-associated Eps domain-containing protein 2 isoform X2 n=1 Tax=Protopterus annectens TaxID=7888 RepID=UPI001CFAF851|nr:ralBP1-associated Eps domain-containing protein 2 isoform X2 [Protopterus annectens]
MEQTGAVTPALLTGLMPLSEEEQRRYADFFSWCQVTTEGGSVGKVAAISKVGDLFKASQLPSDTLHQIMELCGAKRLGYFGPAQFIVALKLIAAAQSGLPVRLESIKSELSLPHFVGVNIDSEMKHRNTFQSSEGHRHQFHIPRTVLEKSTLKHSADSSEKWETLSPPLSPNSPPTSPSGYQSAPPNYGHGKARNANDLQHTALLEGRPVGTAAILQESSTSVNYGVRPSVAQTSVNQPQPAERESVSDESEYSTDPWRITEEQREYYTVQFKTLQPDLSSLISGSVAKNFFTKSKLPIPELSHIWELSDVDCDGALTLPEFCAAFHLIVARKNGYPLPDVLPKTLIPESFTMGIPKAVQDGTLLGSYPDSLPVNQQPKDLNCNEPESINQESARSEPLIVFDEEPPATPQSTSRRTSLEVKPDADFQKPDLTHDSKVQDLSRKISSSLHIEQSDPRSLQESSAKTVVALEVDHQLKARLRPRSYSSTSIDDAMKKVEEPPTPPPRPQKTHSRASSLDLNKLLQQNSQAGKSPWLPPPPPPPPALPPRPPTSQTPLHGASTEPTVYHKHAVQQPKFADFSKFDEQSGQMSKPEIHSLQNKVIHKEENSPVTKTGQITKPETYSTTNKVIFKEEASTVTKDTAPSHLHSKPARRKFRPECQIIENQEPALTKSAPSSQPGTKSHSAIHRQSSKAKKAIQTAIRKNKEANAVLARLNSELQQQFKEVHQDRIALESQLEQLRPLVIS